MFPKPVHLWEVKGFVKLSSKCRNELKKLIKQYRVRRLARNLKFDRETLYSIYSKKKFIHSIFHLVKITKALKYDLNKLEREVTAYGGTQLHIYNFKFPFILSPLHLRAISIHGDGSFYYNKTRDYFVTEWYQKGKRIKYMEKLLNHIIKGKSIKSKLKNKEDNVYYISIPCHLVRFVCKSIGLDLKEFYSIKFFEKIAKLSTEFKFQVFFQFIIDEGHFKGNTLTVSQKKNWSREGFKILIKSLKLDHSDPIDNKNDITIYKHNFPNISKNLDKSINKFGNVAGLWFKEYLFRNSFQDGNFSHFPKIRESTNINIEIFQKLKKDYEIFSYQNIKKFGRTSQDANKAIRNWKKNGLIKRIGFNKYKIL